MWNGTSRLRPETDQANPKAAARPTGFDRNPGEPVEGERPGCAAPGQEGHEDPLPFRCGSRSGRSAPPCGILLVVLEDDEEIGGQAHPFPCEEEGRCSRPETDQRHRQQEEVEETGGRPVPGGRRIRACTRRAYREARAPRSNTIPRKKADRPSMYSSASTQGTGAGRGMRTGPAGRDPPIRQTSPRNDAAAPPPNPAMRDRTGSRIPRAAIPESSQARDDEEDRRRRHPGPPGGPLSPAGPARRGGGAQGNRVEEGQQRILPEKAGQPGQRPEMFLVGLQQKQEQDRNLLPSTYPKSTARSRKKRPMQEGMSARGAHIGTTGCGAAIPLPMPVEQRDSLSRPP